tara:strand:+ start:778 stop:1212 length:435 start_codon:yes stop_codon:yes gene_type:complete
LPGVLSLLALPLLLLSLLLPLGLNLDLCGCAEGGHALFCGASAEEPAPAEEPRGSCCSAPAPVQSDDCADEEEPCPGCPVVELPDFQLDLPVAASSFAYPLALERRGSDRIDLGHGFRPSWTALGSRAPPGKVPRYLLFGRIRC